MPLPIQPVGSAKASTTEPTAEEAPQLWYHRTAQPTAEQLASGSPPRVGSDQCVWLSSFADGAMHKGGTHVVRYVLVGTSAEQMSTDRLALYDSNPPTTTNGFLRQGEHWLGVKGKGLKHLKLDTEWGARPVKKEGGS